MQILILLSVLLEYIDHYIIMFLAKHLLLCLMLLPTYYAGIIGWCLYSKLCHKIVACIAVAYTSTVEPVYYGHLGTIILISNQTCRITRDTTSRMHAYTHVILL